MLVFCFSGRDGIAKDGRSLPNDLADIEAGRTKVVSAAEVARTLEQ
ncbi:MAG: hypothetical protein ABSG64_12305 [Solirubrobacteraceae bacterium]|jgi:hypothetical protein